jgi:hypothetical protein
VSCARCSVHRGDLATDAAFTGARRRLAALAERGDLAREDGVPVRIAGLDRPLPTEYFRCRACGAVWRLVRPARVPPAPNANFESTYPGSLKEMLRVGSATGPALRPPISPFDDAVTLPSPDGRHRASLEDAREIQMGGPNRGTLRVNRMVREDCSPSMVWSDDSEYLAVVDIVDREHPARLVILSMRRREARTVPGALYVVELESFSQGVVHGTHRGEAIEIDVRAILSELGGDPSARRPARAVLRLGDTSVPSDWAFTGDVLRVRALSSAAVNVLVATVVAGGMALWARWAPAAGAGEGWRSIVLAVSAAATLAGLGGLLALGERWIVVLDRAKQTVRASRRARALGPVPFLPERVRAARGGFRGTSLTIEVGGKTLVLAYQRNIGTERLREALVAWMARRVEAGRP